MRRTVGRVSPSLGTADPEFRDIRSGPQKRQPLTQTVVCFCEGHGNGRQISKCTRICRCVPSHIWPDPFGHSQLSSDKGLGAPCQSAKLRGASRTRQVAGTRVRSACACVIVFPCALPRRTGIGILHEAGRGRRLKTAQRFSGRRPESMHVDCWRSPMPRMLRGFTV